MKKILIGLFIGLNVFIALNAFGSQPYNDTELLLRLEQMTLEQQETNKLNKEQTAAIKYLTNVIGEQQEAIIANRDDLYKLDKATIKDIQIKK